MKSSLYLAVASAVLATAGPVGKRAMETEWVYDVVTVTVTADPQPTEFVANNKPQPTTEAPAPAPPPPVAAAAAIEEPETTSQAPPPPPPTTEAAPPPPPPVVETPQPEPEPEPQPEPEPEPVPSQPVGPSGSYKQTVLDQHNMHRSNHSAPDVEWSDELAQYAKNTAEGCVFAHDMNQGAGGYGQNLASYGSSSGSGSDSDHVARAITGQWYNAEYAAFSNFFGMANPPSSSFGAYGHLTQVLWKSSTKVGCHTAKCPAGTVLGMESAYTVCNYNPAGNFNGKYDTNVMAPLGLSVAVLTGIDEHWHE